MTVPINGAIIFVNNDLAPSTRSHLIRQLSITQTLDGYVFDANVAADTNYVHTLRQFNQRVMVVRTFADRGTVPTWPLTDIAIFVKQGLAAVEVNRFGPHGITIPVLKITWGFLGVF